MGCLVCVKTTANKYLILIVLVRDFNLNLFQHVDVASACIGHKADRDESYISTTHSQRQWHVDNIKIHSFSLWIPVAQHVMLKCLLDFGLRPYRLPAAAYLAAPMDAFIGHPAFYGVSTMCLKVIDVLKTQRSSPDLTRSHSGPLLPVCVSQKYHTHFTNTCSLTHGSHTAPIGCAKLRLLLLPTLLHTLPATPMLLWIYPQGLRHTKR